LVAHGRPASTPAALIRWGTTEQQEVVTGTLADIGEKSLRLKPPVVAVIGNVVLLGEQIRWFKELATPAEPVDNHGAQPQIQP
jgi:siroheme synthase